MAQNVDTVIDKPKVDAEFNYLINRFGDIEKKIDGINAKGISFELGKVDDLAGLVKKTNDLAKANDELTISVKEYQTIQNQLAQVTAKMATLDSDAYKNLIAAKVALKEKNDQVKESITGEKQLAAEIKAETDAEKQRTADRLVRQKQEEDGWKRALAIEENLRQVRSADAAEEARIGAEIQNDYKQLTLALKDATDKARAYRFALGANHPLSIQAAQDAKGINDALKAADASVGNFQRNVGNYNPVGAQFNQLLRELPNLAQSPQIFIQSLTNNITYFFEALKAAKAEGQTWGEVMSTIGGNLFGLVGIVNIAVTAFAFLANKYAENEREAKEAAKANDDFAKSIESLGKTMRDTSYNSKADVDKEFYAVSNNNVAMKQRMALLDDLRKKYPDVLKGYSDEAILAGNTADAIDRINKANDNRAKSDAAQKAGGLLGDKISAAKDNVFKLNAQLEEYDKHVAALYVTRPLSVYAPENQGKDQARNRFLQDIDIAKQAVKTYSDELANLKKVSEDSYSASLDVPKENEKEKRATDTINIERRLRDELAAIDLETQKARLETDKKTQEGLIANDKYSWDERTAARYAYYSDDLAILELEKAAELKKNDDLHKADLAEINKAKTTTQNKNNLLQLENERYQKAILEANEKYGQLQMQALGKYADESLKDLEDSTTKETETIKKNLKSMVDYLSDSFHKGQGETRKEYDAYIKGIEDTVVKAMQAFSTIGKSLSSAIYDPQIAKLDVYKQRLQDNYQLEVDQINATSTTQIEATQRIAEADAKYQLAKQDADRKQLQAQRQKAIVDKGINIANIIETTALAVVKTLADDTIKPGYLRIPLAAAVGAAGAAQLAAAIAAPLPGYFTGTDSAAEGLALTGERGRELILGNDGRLSLTPNQPTIWDFQGGEKVFNAIETREILNSMAFNPVSAINTIEREKSNHILAKAYDEVSERTAQKIVRAIDRNGYREPRNNSFFNSPYYKNIKH